jgi:hypothetical protein
LAGLKIRSISEQLHQQILFERDNNKERHGRGNRKRWHWKNGLGGVSSVGILPASRRNDGKQSNDKRRFHPE